MIIKIRNFLFFLISFLLIDLILSYFFINLIFLNIEKTYESDLYNRIPNKDYKYTFKSNTTFISRYNDFVYTIKTNNFGFRDKEVRKITNDKDVIFFAGDSFLEGVGLNFKDTVIGHLQNNKYTYLNSGVSSYSPYLYKKKIIHFLKMNEDMNVKSVVILFDKSDPIDDQRYLSNPESFSETKDLPPYKKKLSDKSITFAFLKLLGNFLDEKRRDIKYRYLISKKYNVSFFDLNHYQITAMKSIGNARFMTKYYTNNLLWESKTKKFIPDSFKNLKDLEEFLLKKNIKLDIILYPWPYELTSKDFRNNYLDYIYSINDDFNLNIHNCYDYFLKDDTLNQLEFIGKSFLLGDIHYNSNGYKVLANCIKDKLFNDE